MKEDKYKILVDYGAYEGMKFYDEADFDTVDEAIKFAAGLDYATKFLIVKVFWKYYN